MPSSRNLGTEDAYELLSGLDYYHDGHGGYWSMEPLPEAGSYLLEFEPADFEETGEIPCEPARFHVTIAKMI